MNNAILIILSTIGVFIGLAVLYSMPAAFLKEFEKQCYEQVKKRDVELEQKEKLNSELRKWLFK